MSSFIGIDLGTQSVKVVLYSEAGHLLSLAQRDYPILTPQLGFAEQEPEVWWKQTFSALQEVIHSVSNREIKAVSFSGQMHGLVMLDKNYKPVCPAIIWADQRSEKEVHFIREKLGPRLAPIAGSDIATGFMAASLCWIKKHRPELYEKTHWVILPKDYLKIKLGLEPSSDVADAASTLLFDIKQRNWSDEIIKELDLKPSLFPPIYESAQIIGQVSPTVQNELGITGDAFVIAGAGDQHCAALGNGIINEGEILITIGTGGQVFTAIQKPIVDSLLRIHTFCHAVPQTWHLLGASLCAGLSLSWFKKSVLDNNHHTFDYSTLDEEAARGIVGTNGLIFLPYLIGERTPHRDSLARGAFINLHLTHQRGDMVRAIMEGVSMAIKDSVSIFEELGIQRKKFIFAGGGAKSLLWRSILSSFLEHPLQTTKVKEEAATGAAILAMVGSDHFHNFNEAVEQIIRYDSPVNPQNQWFEIYRERYQTYRSLYSALKPFFPQ
ncbi:MAG TPA: xylulokinase [Candidatus Atribacteria bacterium]|nr:xylulokinase [Candidatus Atribacteria bacterium]HCU22902.1 xylulokinase [Candidatus Atribacteria bacterium]